MAQFKQWALEYVLSDDESAQLDITKKAARGEIAFCRLRILYALLLTSFKEIESSRASSTVVGGWAASVQQWMTPTSIDDDRMDDGDEGGSGDIIARAKGMLLMPVFRG